MSDDEQPKDDAATDTTDATDSEETPTDENGEAAEGTEEGSEEGAEDGDGEEVAPPGIKAKLVEKFTANKKRIIIVAGVLVGIIGIGSGIYFSGFFHVEKTNEITLALPDPLVYHEIPRITVDLKPGPKHPRPFIRMTIQADRKSVV